MSPPFRPLFPFAVAAALLAVGASPSHSRVAQEPVPRHAPTREPVPQEPAPPPALDPKQALREIRTRLVAGGSAAAKEVAARVRELGRLDLDAATREDWVRVARLVALRLGDRAWLEALRDHDDTVRTELGYAVMLARSQVEHANLGDATATLDRLGDVDGVNEREKRRVYALRARIAELEGRTADERRWVDEMIGHLYMWPRQRCQECHATTKQPDVVTTLPIADLWFGGRYVALLQAHGDAEAVRRAAADDLAADPSDDDARIRLAFALRALGREDEAMARFRELDWAAVPGREPRPPRQFATYP